MREQPFKVGIIGAGSVVRQFHFPGWKSLPGVEISAIADVDMAAARDLASQCEGAAAVTDYRDLLNMDLDAVDICTPNQLHAGMVIAALEAGKHVLCEKPLAIKAADIKAMGEMADRKGLKLMTAQHYRFGSQARAAKAWAREHLGPAYHARVRAMRRRNLPTQPGFIDKRLSGGGPCMDIGVHALDIALWLMDFPNPLRVSGSARVNFAMGKRIAGGWGEWDRKLFSVEDFASGFVHFQDGATLVLETAWLGHQTEEEDISCQIFGLEGGISWPSGEHAACEAGIFQGGRLEAAPDAISPRTEELRAFRDCVLAGAPSPVPWRESLKTIAILEAIYISQTRGREVEISLGAI
jgi:predicted dehydrogenase